MYGIRLSLIADTNCDYMFRLKLVIVRSIPGVYIQFVLY